MIDLTPHILYEDDDILAINKPAGLVVHPDGRTKESSVSEWFVERYPSASGVGEAMDVSGGGSIERPGVVHRIDRETSGVLLLAKTKAGHAHLKEQFQNREIEKVYHLFVYGLVKNDFGSVRLPIGKSASDFRKWSAERGAKGEKREALTYYRVLKRVRGESLTLVEAKPKTGRTHQIRVHFRAIHHPILRDKLYGPKVVPHSLGEVGRIFTRLALHSRSIVFKNVAGQEIVVEAPYPEDFRQAIDNTGFAVLN